MPSISVPAAIAIGAGVSTVGSVAGGMMQASGAKSAAATQANAQTQAAMLQKQMFDEQQANLKPYIDAGTAALPALQGVPDRNMNLLMNANAAAQSQIPLNVSAETIKNMPGYEFNLQQGLKATQAANAARGWGVGGEALKGAANFSTGLSNSYFQSYFGNQQNIFQDYNQLYSNLYNNLGQNWNQLTYLPTLGENAAATSGYQANQAGANIGSNIAGAGQALAAGQAAASKAMGGSIANAGNNALNAYLGYQALGGGSAYGSYGSSNATDPYNGMSGLSQNTLNTIQSNAASAPTYVANSGLGEMY